MKRVIVESPFKGDIARNRRYLEFTYGVKEL